MNGTSVLFGQMLTVFSIVVAGTWGATQWTAAHLGYQLRLGSPWFDWLGIPFYHPWRLFEWWYWYDAYAPRLFLKGGAIAAASGVAAAGVAIGMSVWRARQSCLVTTYGSARWADARDIRKAGLMQPAGVFLGLHDGQYLRHEGPEHVLTFAPTRSGKGVGLVIPTLLSWPASAVNRLLQENIRGVEKKPLPHMLAMTNMMLHGIDVPTRIRHDNTLSRPFKDYGPRDRVDIIITNPPFGGIEEDGIEKNFLAKHQTRETADLFMALIMHLLRHDTGRAAVVLPDGFLFGEGVKTTLKRELLDEFNLHTIVRLPKGVFAPYTSIATNLLFFEKGGPTKDVWFFEHPYPAGYKSYSRSKPLVIEEFDCEKTWWGGPQRKGRKTTEHAWKVSAKDLAARNYNLDCKNPHEVAVEVGDPDELMAEYQDITRQLQAAQQALKTELLAALKATSGEA